MRTPSLVMLALAAAAGIATPAAAAPPSTSRMFASGFGAASVIHYEDANGVVTEGYLFGITINHGALPDVPYDEALVFFGTRFDPALGYAVTFTGAAPAAYTANGLAGAHLAATVVADPFYDGSDLPPDPLPPITIAVDLRFSGVGATHLDGGRFAEGSAGSVYVLYDATRWRYANVAGSASVDGGAATVDTAQLLAETSGEFDLVAQPGR